MTKAFDLLVRGDRFEMTISWSGAIVLVEVEVDAPAQRQVCNSLMLRGHIVGTNLPINAFGKVGTSDRRTLVS